MESYQSGFDLLPHRIYKTVAIMTEEADLDFDSLLGLEEEFYTDSYNSAFEKGSEHTQRDGKQFGIQTGFQRFILVGALKRVSEILISLKEENSDSGNNNDTEVAIDRRKGKTARLHKSLVEILKTLEKFYSEDVIQVSNTPREVDFFEEQMKKIKSKAKTVYSQLGYKSLYADIEKTCTKVAGNVPTTQINGEEQDMW